MTDRIGQQIYAPMTWKSAIIGDKINLTGEIYLNDTPILPELQSVTFSERKMIIVIG